MLTQKMFFNQDLHLFLSEQSAQKYLQQIYEKQKFSDSERMSYLNCVPFLSYIEQAKLFIEQADQAPISLKPILLFYGFVHGIKACLLTVDPYYPESTSVLAHGVSTRKRKKQHYNYLMDEIKVQKHGLFPHFAYKLFNVNHLCGEKVNIKSLLIEIPEMENILLFIDDNDYEPIFIKVEKDGTKFRIPDNILDYYKMTKDRYMNYFETKCTFPIHWKKEDDDYISFTSSNYSGKYPHDFTPLRFDIFEKTYKIQTTIQRFSVFSEMMIFYLLLYHLSMIARYEVEWWSELLKSTTSYDYPIILHFLHIATQKCPFLINQFLYNKKQEPV